MPEPTCWAEELRIQLAQRMYQRGLSSRPRGTDAQEQAALELCYQAERRRERDNEGDN